MVFFVSMKFNTVLYKLRSAKNIGMIARSHISFGGNFLILVGGQERWKFKGGTHSYTRKLEDLGKLLIFETDQDFFAWSERLKIENVGVEIGENEASLINYDFPDNCNLIFGNERTGLPKEVIEKMVNTITIPQYGEVGSLNVAVAASIVFYEMKRSDKSQSAIEGEKFKSVDK